MHLLCRDVQPGTFFDFTAAAQDYDSEDALERAILDAHARANADEASEDADMAEDAAYEADVELPGLLLSQLSPLLWPTGAAFAARLALCLWLACSCPLLLGWHKFAQEIADSAHGTDAASCACR